MDKPRAGSKVAVFFVCLVVLDAVTKLLAFHYLPHGVRSWRVRGVGALYPAINPIDFDMFNHTTRSLFLQGTTPTPPVEMTLLTCALALTVMALKRMKIRTGLKWIFGLVLMGFVSHSIRQTHSFGIVEPERGPLIVVVRFLIVASLLLFYQYSAGAWFRAAYILTIAGAVGNMVSYCYPPWHAIDFIWSFRLKAVFNFADSYIALGGAMLLLSPVYLVISWLIRTVRGSKFPPRNPGAASDYAV